MSLYSALQKRIEALRKTHHSREVVLHFSDGSSCVIQLPAGGALPLLTDLMRLRSWQLGRPEGRELEPDEVPFVRDDGGLVPKTCFAKEVRMLAAAASVESEDPLVEIAHGLAVEVFEAERKVGTLAT